MDTQPIDELIEKYAAGTASPEELQQLLDWYRSADIGIVEWPAQSPDEKEKLQQRMLQRLEQGMKERPYVMQGVAATPDVPERPATVIPLPRFRNNPWLRAAACLVLVAGSWAIWRTVIHHPLTYISIYNPSGKIQRVTLPDSSKVLLNAESSIRYTAAFTGQREVFLDGEAYFDVSTDKEHPFVVHSGALTTTVLGTAFDIQSFSTERQNSVTVIRGKVQVQDSTKVLDVLTPARQLQWDGQTHKAETVSIDTNQVTAWQHGKFEFRDQTLKEITLVLARWYHVQFVFAKPPVKDTRYHGIFDNTMKLEQILTLLSSLNDMNFTINNATHTVTLSGKVR